MDYKENIWRVIFSVGLIRIIGSSLKMGLSDFFKLDFRPIIMVGFVLDDYYPGFVIFLAILSRNSCPISDPDTEIYWIR